MREERVALEDGVDVALVRRQSGDRAVAEVDRPRARLLEAADHAQRRRLAAARRAEQRVELAALDLEREVVDGDDVVELLRHVLEADVGAHAVADLPFVVEVQAPAVDLLRELQVEERLGRDDAGDRADAVRQLEQVAAVDAQHLDEHVEAAGGDHDVARFAPSELISSATGSEAPAVLTPSSAWASKPSPSGFVIPITCRTSSSTRRRVAGAHGRLGDAELRGDRAERFAPVRLQRLDDAAVDPVERPGPVDRPAAQGGRWWHAPVLQDPAHCVNRKRRSLRNESGGGARQGEFVEATGTARLAPDCVRDVGVFGGAREAHDPPVERPGRPDRGRARDVEALADGLVGRTAAVGQASLHPWGERVAVAVPGVGEDERPPVLLRSEPLPERDWTAWALAGRLRAEDPVCGLERLRVRDLVVTA